MSPLNSSPTHQSSSSSTTPPSETTLADDPPLISGTMSPSRQQCSTPINHRQDQHSGHVTKSDPEQNRDQILNAINTDYESSAAEDLESYTLNKYENAEFALLSYSRTNKIDKLQRLLDAKLRNEVELNINFKGQQKQNFSWSALHLACYFGHSTIVELLLSKKQLRDEIDINIQNNSGDTPLHKATLTDRIKIVQLLLSNGADVFIKNSDGLCAKQLTTDSHISEMLEAAEQVDKNRVRQEMSKAIDCGDLIRLKECLESYGSHAQKSQDMGSASDQGENVRGNTSEDSNCCDMINQLIDERGNSLLHLAAMRGCKAICIYLLEQGFDPYKRNSAGQTCFDLTSYQLRQLFASVKPTDCQLRKFSKQRVIRFEGPLLKKVRILGWKQIYVVLENGVILLFNNRKDLMNKSRRGYKYLESATCITEASDVGMFTVCFSDKSRATFLVNADHLNSYPTFTSSTTDQSKSTPFSQVELIRQKWIDSIRDHIQYSTNFIKNGLKLNDYDDEYQSANGSEDVVTLNHLLPIDTIKSFIHEARAHYSILERHADSLCNLVQSINSSGRFDTSIETSRFNMSITQPAGDTQPNVTASGTGSRLLGLIRTARQSRNSSSSGEDGTSAVNQQTTLNELSRIRNNTLTNEFVQDNWHCILFHLRLLKESTDNTKTSMGQALALMEHQEQLRQIRLQEQEERCRVLEDSLHALARDHHELEKSISMSQIYQSAAGLSMSMSTDLNEYFDAFEDFDDEKTVTPNSMPSDEDLHRKIQEVMNDSDQPIRNLDSEHEQFGSDENISISREQYDLTDVEEEEDDDLRSNCSALTVETISEQFNSLASDQRRIANLNEIKVTSTQPTNLSRTRLPSPMVPRDQVSIWSILKNCIGKELSKITMPVVFNEPLTMLQRACEGIQYCHFLKMADLSDDPVERMELICAFIVAGLSCNCHRIIKPFNPLLYETYEYDHELEDGTHVRAMAQQVSHHPPITAAYCESDNFIYNGSVNPKIKFWGRSIEVQPDGQCRIYLKGRKESYIFKSVSCSIHNIIVGKLWFEHGGPLDIKCAESNIQANLLFKQAGWFNNDVHRFEGFISVSGDSSPEKKKFVYGKWSHYIKTADYSEYENYMKENQHKLFRIPDEPDAGQSNGLISKLSNLNITSSQNSVNNNSITSKPQTGESSSSTIATKPKSLFKGGDKKGGYTKSESAQSLDIPNSRTLWRLEAQYLEEYYNFTHFTMKLNELSPELAKTLPATDSRFRQDVRKLEEGDLDGAAAEKQRLEEKQRAARARDHRFKDPSPGMLWFEHTNVPYSKEKFWIYKGGYWENRCNQEKFPDLF